MNHFLVEGMINTAEVIYEHNINPNSSCDIGLHLPTLRAAAHGDVVEIGTRGGASTSALILGVREHGGHVYSIDINEKCGTEVLKDVPEWTFIRGHSMSNAPEILARLPHEIDVLFIDGDHSYPAVCSDLVIYGALVRRGGVIFLHDTELEGAGVRRAVTEYSKAIGAKLEFITGCYGLGKLTV